jgi:hypothetical protein
VRIGAEILSPSHPSGIALELESAASSAAASFGPGASLQRILRLSLHEEGEHTLAVTVTYTETSVGGGGQAAGGRVRTFRKLYQFVAASLISVRTKACEVLQGKALEQGRGVYVLEAQLENLGDYGVVLEVSFCSPFLGFVAFVLFVGWDADGGGLLYRL